MKRRLSATYCMLTCVLGVSLLFSSCDDDEKASIEYPATGFYGENFLSKDKTSYTTEKGSLQAKIPAGQKLKVIITALDGAYPNGLLYYAGGSGHNWAISDFDWSTNQQIYISIDAGLTCTLQMYFNVGRFQFDYYENDDTSPTATKTIEVK